MTRIRTLALSCSLALSLNACASTPAGVEATGGPDSIPSAENGAVQRFVVKDTYGGRIPSGASSRVVRDQTEYDSFVGRLPKFKIQKGPREESDDALVKQPAIDFSKDMLVVATCDTFYCSVSIRGYVLEEGAMVVLMTQKGEPEGAEMAQRPISMDGSDSMGNYTAIVVPKHDGDVRLE